MVLQKFRETLQFFSEKVRFATCFIMNLFIYHFYSVQNKESLVSISMESSSKHMVYIVTLVLCIMCEYCIIVYGVLHR